MLFGCLGWFWFDGVRLGECLVLGCWLFVLIVLDFGCVGKIVCSFVL